MLQPKKIIITGGAGFVGSHLSNRLISEGYEVHIIDNLISGNKKNIPKKAIFHKADICNYKKILPLFKGVHSVFHLAALPSVEFSIQNPLKAHETNITGTVHVFRAASEANVRKVIFASSSSVYGDQKIKQLHEKLTPNPKSPYALQKHMGEEYATLWKNLYNLNILSLRFFNIYGPGQHDTGPYAFVIAKFLKLKKEGKRLEITGDGNQTRDFVHISDVIEACMKALHTKTAPGDSINIGGGKGVSIKQIARMIGGNTTYTPSRIEPKHTESNNLKALKILAWKPCTPISQGIKDLLSQQHKPDDTTKKYKRESR